MSVCVMDQATGWCEGCFRTIKEIGGWSRFSDAERDKVMSELPARRAQAGKDRQDDAL